MHQLESRIRAIPDFPKPGILYRDITPLLGDPAALALAARELAAPFTGQGIRAVAGIEARGFIFGCLVAREIAARIAAKSPQMVNVAKRSLNGTEDGNLEDKYRWEQGFTFEAYLLADSAEARKAFAEGREPDFE